MIIVSLLTRSEPKEKLRKFYTLLNTPVGKEQRLRDQDVDIILEGISEGKSVKKTRRKSSKFSIIDKLFPHAGDEEDGLLVVDLLSLKKKFRWARYRTDILGFLLSSVVVLLLILMLVLLSRYGG